MLFWVINFKFDLEAYGFKFKFLKVLKKSVFYRFFRTAIPIDFKLCRAVQYTITAI